MALYDYSLVPKDAVAKAQAYDLDASYKDLSQVCRAIKRRTVPEAVAILEDAVDLAHAIPYQKFNKGMGHRSELGGQPGRYPRKEARLVLALLENAANNAEYKGHKAEELVVSHAAAYKQNQLPRYRHHWAGSVTLGYGKQNYYANYVTARVELVLSPMPEEQKAARAQRAKYAPKTAAKAETKPAPKTEAKKE
jgi:ribosomal protein uL22